MAYEMRFWLDEISFEYGSAIAVLKSDSVESVFDNDRSVMHMVEMESTIRVPLGRVLESRI